MSWLKKLLRKEGDHRRRKPKALWKDIADRSIYLGNEAKTKEILRNTEADIHNERGFEYHQKREFDKAIKEFKKALEIQPHESHYMNLGNALVSKGTSERDRSSIKEGIKALEQALRMNPGFQRAEKNLAVAKQVLSAL